MRILILLILLGLSLTSQAHEGADFFIMKPGELRIERAPRQRFTALNSGNCRDRITQVMCLVDSSSGPTGLRKCQPGGEAFAPSVEKIYDLLPVKLQKVFCGLDAIFVESDMESLAYAGLTQQGPNGPVGGAVIGVRRALLEQAYDATSVLGWKEQKAFGLKAPPFVHLPEGPRVDITLPGSLSALQYVLIHEIGHIVDFSNRANDFVCPPGETCKLESGDAEEFKKLLPVPGSWSALSWKNAVLPRDEFHFPLWDSLCFYGCSKSLSVNDMEPFYRELSPTNFVTTYSAVSPFEDFAESFTFYVLSLQGDWSYQVQTPFTSYSLEQKWHSLPDKKSWMDAFYNRDLQYPTPTN